MAEKVGVFNRLWLSAAASDATYTELEFLEGSQIGLQEQFLDSNGMVGSRTRPSERVRQGPRQTTGSLSLQPTPLELDKILTWALGGTKSGDTVALAERPPARWLRTYRDGLYHTYDGVYVGRITFAAGEGSLLTVSLDLQGVDETASGAPTSPGGIDLTGGPYTLFDCVTTVGGTAYPFRNFQVSVDNRLEVKFNNSITPSSINPTDRQTQVMLGLPLGDASALYGSAVSGVQVVSAFTNGTRSLTLTLPKVQAPRQPLPLGTRQALTLSWGGTARGTGGAAGSELVVANDSTI